MTATKQRPAKKAVPKKRQAAAKDDAFEAKVAEAKRLVAVIESAAQEQHWRLAKLCAEVDSKRLDQFAEGIGYTTQRVRHLRRTWERYGPSKLRLPEVTKFNDYVILAGRADDLAKQIVARAKKQGISIRLAAERISAESANRHGPVRVTVHFDEPTDVDLCPSCRKVNNIQA